MGVNYRWLNTDKHIMRKLATLKVDAMISNEKDNVRRSLVIPQYQRSRYCLCKEDQSILEETVWKI